MSNGNQPEPKPDRIFEDLTGGELHTPPVPEPCRSGFGRLLRLLQKRLPVPPKCIKSMRTVGPGCYELRLSDESGEWRLVFHLTDAKVRALHVFHKKAQKTPRGAIELCQRRLAANPE